MKFMTRTAGYSSLDDKRKEDIAEGLNVEPVENKLIQYEQKLRHYMHRTAP